MFATQQPAVKYVAAMPVVANNPGLKRVALTEAERQRIYSGNAKEFFGL